MWALGGFLPSWGIGICGWAGGQCRGTFFLTRPLSLSLSLCSCCLFLAFPCSEPFRVLSLDKLNALFSRGRPGDEYWSSVVVPRLARMFGVKGSVDGIELEACMAGQSSAMLFRAVSSEWALPPVQAAAPWDAPGPALVVPEECTPMPSGNGAGAGVNGDGNRGGGAGFSFSLAGDGDGTPVAPSGGALAGIIPATARALGGLGGGGGAVMDAPPAVGNFGSLLGCASLGTSALGAASAVALERSSDTAGSLPSHGGYVPFDDATDVPMNRTIDMYKRFEECAPHLDGGGGSLGLGSSMLQSEGKAAPPPPLLSGASTAPASAVPAATPSLAAPSSLNPAVTLLASLRSSASGSAGVQPGVRLCGAGGLEVDRSMVPPLALFRRVTHLCGFQLSVFCAKTMEVCGASLSS
jgi:hypothetical protein